MQKSKTEKKFSFSLKHADSIQKKIQFTMVQVVTIAMIILFSSLILLLYNYFVNNDSCLDNTNSPRLSNILYPFL